MKFILRTTRTSPNTHVSPRIGKEVVINNDHGLNDMESNFFKPIGDIYKSGSSVNGKDAFIKPSSLPLRAKRDKAIDSKPLKPGVGDSLPLRAANKMQLRAAIKPQPLPEPEKVKQKQKKIAEATTQSATAEKSTTTTPATTSRDSSTTTTTPRTTETMPKKSWVPKDKTNKPPRDQAGGRKGDSPFFTSSTTVEPSGDMKAFNIYDKNGDSAPFVVEGIAGSVSWIPKTSSPSLLRPDVASGPISGGETSPKFMVNLTSFGQALADSAANPVSYYNNFMLLLYNRWTVDVMRITKGIVPSFWTKANLVSTLIAVVSALEYFYCLDSILSFQNVGVSGLTGSRTLEMYGNTFNLPQVLIARDNLRRYLQGTWCPPGISLMMRGFYQYYRTSNVAGQANIFRYVSDDDFVKDLDIPTSLGTNITNTVEAFRVSLSQTVVVQTMGLLSNTHPFGIINGLPKSSIDAQFSENMLEVFVNEPSLYSDPNNTALQSVSPISYSGTINDIPYYACYNPSMLNGYNFALQFIAVTTATSGNAYATVSNYYGLRRMLAYTPGAAATLSNKFVFDASLSKFEPRSIFAVANMVTGIDAHMVLNIGSVTTKISNAPLGWQRVYYDNQNAPSTLFNMLVSTIFGTSV